MRPWPRRPPSSLLSALVVLLVLLLAGMAAAVEKYLFLPDSDSQVEELLGESLDRVKTGREPYAVMFYSPTCPHCV